MALSTRKLKGMLALMECGTQEAAAKQAGVSARTLRGWLREDEFRTEFLRMRREVVSHAMARLQAATHSAVETLETILRGAAGDPAPAVAAARAIITLGIKAVETEDYGERLSAIEQQLAQEGRPVNGASVGPTVSGGEHDKEAFLGDAGEDNISGPS